MQWGTDPANITNRVILFLLIKNLYNRDIRRWVAGTKIINTFADAFRLAHHNLLKLKTYERLVYNKDQTIEEINEIADSTSNMKVNNQPKTSNRDQQNKNNKNYTSGATVGSVVNVTTQQRNANII